MFRAFVRFFRWTAMGVIALAFVKVLWMGLAGLDAVEIINGAARDEILQRRAYIVHRMNQILVPDQMHPNLWPHYQGEWAVGTASMASAALANIAFLYPETREESLQVVDRLLDWMMTPAAMSFDTIAWKGEDAMESLANANGHIGYLGHLNFMLGAYHALGGRDEARTDLFHRVSAALDRKALAAPRLCPATYPRSIFIADNSVVYASLRLHERFFPQRRHPVIDRWVREIESHLRDKKTGLLVHTVWPDGKPRQRVRGCTIGWNSFYLPFVDAGLADRQYAAAKTHLIDRALGLFTGLREYPRGVRGSGDIDSGPVVMGLSTSGTGFIMAGARLHGDAELLQKLLRTAEFVGFSYGDRRGRRYLTSPLVGDAIMLAMQTATPWDERFFRTIPNQK